MVTQQPTGARDTARHAKHRAPGLDGIRALAVLAVLAFHEGLRMAPGGFLGVDIFFVLSGYLITDLLVAQHNARGRLDLRGFWTRRARRLLPALAVLLVVVTAAVAVFEPDQLGPLRPTLVAALTYSSNWYQALHHVSYFATFGPPPPLQHLWSLAIEEQFYLAWPLVVALLLTRVHDRLTRRALAWLGAAISALLAVLLYTPGGDPSRVYYGTDTHSTALLVGAALALTWPMNTITSAHRTLVRRLDLAGLAGLIVLGWAVGHFAGSDPAVYPAGLVVAALAAGALVLAATTPGAVSALLSVRPLRWLGVRSYGIYLWHWPVIAIALALTNGRPVPGLWVAESIIAIGLAAASWRWLESPILTYGFRPTVRSGWLVVGESIRAARSSPMRALPALAAVAAVCVACTAGYGVLNAPATTSMSAEMQQVALGERVSAQTRAAAPHPDLRRPAGNARPAAGARHVPGWQVTAIGDSVMLSAAVQLHHALPGIYIDAAISRQMSAGLAVVGKLARHGLLRRVVLVDLGTNGTVTTGQIRALVSEIGPGRVLVLVNTFEARPWEHEVNSVLAAAARRYANVVLANWLVTIHHRTGLLWPDGVHPRPQGAALYARVVAAAVQATGPGRAGPAGGHCRAVLHGCW